MIQANELRIGCIITASGRGGYCEVTGIKKQKARDGYYFSVIVNDEKEDHLLEQQCFSIPLTPEILIGINEFERESELSWKHREFSSIRIVEGGDLFMLHKGSAGAICPINSVHHLQNLIYALTQTELNIKL